MTKIPKESADQKDIVWYYHGSCMPKTLRGSKAILLGGSTWLRKCVRALHFPLLGFEAGLERENAWNYWEVFYEDLLQGTFDIRTGNTKDGWKKHGIDRQPFFWFGTPSNKIEMQMTKIPKESADQKDSVWYYQGSCMPKTLRGSKAILLGGSTWLSKCVRALHFPLLGFETGLERENAWNYWDIFYKDLLQVTFNVRTGNTKDGWTGQAKIGFIYNNARYLLFANAFANELLLPADLMIYSKSPRCRRRLLQCPRPKAATGENFWHVGGFFRWSNISSSSRHKLDKASQPSKRHADFFRVRLSVSFHNKRAGPRHHQ